MKKEQLDGVFQDYVKFPGRERAGEFKESIGGKASFTPEEEGEIVGATLCSALLASDSQLGH